MPITILLVPVVIVCAHPFPKITLPVPVLKRVPEDDPTQILLPPVATYIEFDKGLLIQILLPEADIVPKLNGSPILTFEILPLPFPTVTGAVAFPTDIYL